MVQRFDTGGKLGKAKKTSQGGILVLGSLTRSGVLEYKNPDGTIRREYRDEKEVFDAASLLSLRGAPVTNLHPPQMVSPDTFKNVAVGNLVMDPVQEKDHVVSELMIQDARTMNQIEKGERNEISCGYVCEIDPTPGVTPGGERYDVRQTEIRYNHVALVPRGRAGSTALRLDANDDQIPDRVKEEKDMKVERIDGVEYEIDTEAHRDAIKRRDEAEGKLAAELATLRSDNASLEARLDGKKEDIEVAVQARVGLLAKASAHGVEANAGMAPEEITKAIAAKVLPGVDLEGKSIEYLAGAIDSVKVPEKSESDNSAASVRQDLDDVRNDAGAGEYELSPSEKARENSLKALYKEGGQ